MAAASNIPLPAPLRITSNLAVEWKRFKGLWTNYVKAAKVNREAKDCQAAIFLACIGSDAYDIYTTMELDDDDRNDPDKLIDAFERHCIGEINEVYERYVFHRRQQEPGESFDAFVGELRRLVKTCEYGAIEESAIRDRIVLGIRDDATRRKLLQTRKLDLAKAIDICRSSEVTTRQLKAMTSPEEVQAMNQQQQQHRSWRPRSQSRHRRGGGRGGREPSRTRYDGTNWNRSAGDDRRASSTDIRCRYCNRTHEPSKSVCPAYKSSCKRCNKRGHWAVVCRSTGSTATGNTSVCELESEETLFSLDNAESRRIYANVFVNGRKVRFLLDCGSTVNLLPVSFMTSSTVLRPSRAPLRMFDRTELKTLGMLTATVRHPRTRAEFDVEFYVTAREDPILGIDACRRLDMLRIVEENICAVQEVVGTSPRRSIEPPPLAAPRMAMPNGRITEAAVFARYADLFDGSLGHLEGDVHLEIDSTVPPVQLPLRRIPIAMRDRVEAELRKMTDEGILAPITDATDWVSALLIVTKPSGGIRVCIDPSRLNIALKRSTYYMPTIDDVLPKLSNVKVMSTVDLDRAFYHLTLDEQSSRLTTFQTPFGRFRWLRLPFGVSPAPEIFQARIHAALSGLNGVHCIADDVLVTGSGADVVSAQRDHDANLFALLERCRLKGLKLNKEKFRLNRTKLTFLGHELTTSGLRPDPTKVRAIQEMPIPEDRAALRRILGMATFLARYCPMFSETTAVLRELLSEENEYCWDIRHTDAYNRLKVMLCREPVLQYFAPDKPITVQSDASKSGIGAVLMQEGKVVEYASRALSKAEVQYAQCEKELLSILFAMQKFDTYCFARVVRVETDHKPLIAIHKKSLNVAPKRLQRMLLSLQRWQYELIWLPTSQMTLSDTLSRSFPPTGTEETKFTETLASLSTADADQMAELKMVASAETIGRLQTAAKDTAYAKLIKQVTDGWPESPSDVEADLRPFHTFADELSISCGLCFKGHRLIVPQPLRADILDRLQISHSGYNACLRRSRETVYWPGITADIRRMVESCQICASHQQAAQKEPLLSHPAPSRVWEKVGVDIFTLGDRDYLVTVDYLSGYFEVDRLPSKKVTDIVYCLRQHFCRHGLPAQVVSDNSPFNSGDFKRFAARYEFVHTTSSPRYSQSNGRSENAVKTCKRIMTRAQEAGIDPLLALLEWRNTPSEQLGPSPAQLMFGRRTRTGLPIADRLLNSPTSHAASAALAAAKNRQAFYYNRGAKERPPLQAGQTVRVKYDDRPEWRKAEVAEVLPHRSYSVRFPDGTTRRRTSRHVRFSSEKPIVFGDDDADESQTRLAAHNVAPSSGRDPNHASRQLGGAPLPPPPPPTPPTVTRSGRIVKRPARYTNYE